jgi:hypothetical protein
VGNLRRRKDNPTPQSDEDLKKNLEKNKGSCKKFDKLMQKNKLYEQEKKLKTGSSKKVSRKVRNMRISRNQRIKFKNRQFQL